MIMDYAELAERSDNALQRLSQIKDRETRRDLNIMHGVLVKLLNELDQESVNCRRLKHKTLTYQERERKVLQQLENIEKNLTFASLL